MSSHSLLSFFIDIVISLCYYNRKYVRMERDMSISYKKLWKLLIDRDMMKKDLAQKANISSASIAKLGRNENVNTDIILKICTALECDFSDIMEIVDEDK